MRDYWNILRKRMRMMALIFCGVLLLGLVFNFSSPTLYTAKSTLKIEPQNPSITGVGGVGEGRQEGGGGPYDFYQTQYTLLKSQPLAARVVKQLGLESNSAFTARMGSDVFSAILQWMVGSILNTVNWLSHLVKEAEPPAESRPPTFELGVAPRFVGQYLKYLEVTPIRNTRLVDISFSTPSARLSQQMANAHASGFSQMILEDRFNLNEGGAGFPRQKTRRVARKSRASGKRNESIPRKARGRVPGKG